MAAKKIVKGEGTEVSQGFVTFASLPHLGMVPFTDANETFDLVITEDDVKDALCGDVQKCVLANACHRNFGAFFEYVIVGKTVMHVVINGVSKRFALGKKLEKAVTDFDKSKDGKGNGKWNIPLGTYTIGPLPPSGRRLGRPNRHAQGPHNGGKKQGLSQIAFAPSRVILNRKAAPKAA
jgi:hypothetical protein